RLLPIFVICSVTLIRTHYAIIGTRFPTLHLNSNHNISVNFITTMKKSSPPTRRFLYSKKSRKEYLTRLEVSLSYII
ncbi:MAG: hypothetical protein ACRD5B_08210, partial [Nitrososphaeraceae archaeon]